jgi:integrase
MRTKVQRGYILRKGPSWFLRYYDTELRHGEAVRVQKCVFLAKFSDSYRSEKSVRALAAEKLAPVNEGKADVRSTMTVREFISGTYLPEIERTKRPSTAKNAEDVFRIHVKPRLGTTTLRDFRCCDAERLLADVTRQAKTKDGQPLSHNSLMRVKSFLSGAFSTALRLGALDGVNPIRYSMIHGGTPARVTGAYGVSEIRQILAVLREPAKTIVAVAAYSGLRQGEIAGLKWEDYDGDTLTVRRSMWRGQEQSPKTASSAAPIPVAVPLREALDLYRSRLGVLAQPDFPVFMSGGKNKQGQPTPINLANVARRVIVPAIERCKVCRKNKRSHVRVVSHDFQLDTSLVWLGWHAFRRGLATTLHANHIADKEIQSILRHSNVAVTQGCYIKSVRPSQIAALAVMTEEMGNPNVICNESATRVTGPIN